MRAGDRPPDLATVSRAAFLLLGESGALAGSGIRARPGLVVRCDEVPASEMWRAKGCRVTSPRRGTR